MKKSPNKSNLTLSAITLLLSVTILAGSVPLNGSMAQPRGQLEEEPSDLPLPSEERNVTQQNETTPTTTTATPEGDDTATNLISCSAASNPCVGTDGDDDMRGDVGTNSIHGKIGNDLLMGGDANDGLYGYEGDDIIVGGQGNDGIDGYEGNDKIDGSEGGDSIHGSQGNDVISGGQGDDGLGGDDGKDYVKGDAGADYILAGKGDDSIWHNTEEGPTKSDGSKDIIDCGEGTDRVWINQSDGDMAYSCETVNEESIPGGTPSDDLDNDFVPDYADNCPKRSNNSQMDSDGDGAGDACDSDLDADSDGITDLEDNCDFNANPDQKDSNNDGVGDVCAANRLKVSFNSITIHNPHEPGFFSATSDAEFDLAVYVQGKKIDLTDASVNCIWAGVDFPPCGLGDADWKETINFNQPGQDVRAEVTVDMPKGTPLSIFTVGHEVDECGRVPFSEKISQVEESVVRNTLPEERYSKIAEIQKRLNSYDCDSTFENDNEVLGTLNEFYDAPSYQAGPHEVISSTKDFTLRYTIGLSDFDPVKPDALRVIRTGPENGAVDVDQSSSVSVTFNKPVQKWSIDNNFKMWLTAAGRVLGTNVAGTTSLSSDGKTATFTASKPLISGTSHTAVIENLVRATSGETLESNYRWSFVTGGPPNPNACNGLIAAPNRIESVTAKSSESSFPPENSIDKNLDTKWMSTSALKPWIKVDLGHELPICKVDIAWADGSIRQYNFIISISSDGTNFVKVFSGTSSGTTSSPERYSFAESNARYVRIMLSDDSDTIAQISEIAAIGRYT
ncbi:MAG TPA: discoidin domain-containing protein [Nitrososphaeraceae archaeon]|nr:discoidin domain-containing protein [Nitrososphaeraceae archaeon]